MNWIKNFVKPKIKALVSKDVPENLWDKCPSCDSMIFHRKFAENLYVCPECNYHLRISADYRLKNLFDTGLYEKIDIPKVIKDPLQFKDIKKYTERLKEAKAKTKLEDAIIIAKGTIDQNPVICAAMDFNFMGGSMGAGVGEAITVGIEQAIKQKSAFIIVTASGGARMQEGIISLMQMAKTIIAVNKLKSNKLPYIVIFSDPTSGGVTASFAMLGDIHIAEPKATICFAGRRVIEQTIKEKLPDDFQTSESLKKHGMLDMIVQRSQLKSEIAKILSILMAKK